MKFFTKENILSPSGIILILHTVGLIFILSPWKEIILPLSWVNLGIAGFLILANHKDNSKTIFIIWAAIAFLTGMVTEAIGTNTGLLFGTYAYEVNLGPKVFAVPLIIGVNWTYLIICSASIAILFSKNKLAQTIIASLLMVLMDFLIEPVAIDLAYWHWYGAEIPLFNYITWFLVALPLSALYIYWPIEKQNKLAVHLYITQFVFFAFLNFAL